MKQIIKLILLAIIILEINLIIAQTNAEKININKIISGEVTNEEQINQILENPEYLKNLNQELAKNQNNLNKDTILRKKWLEHYNIKDENAEIKLISSDDKIFIQTGNQKRITIFELEKIKIRKIQNDGTIELEESILFSEGTMSFDEKTNKIEVQGGKMDITNWNKEKANEFNLKDEAKVILNQEVFMQKREPINFIGKKRIFELLPPEEPLDLKIDEGKIAFNGIAYFNENQYSFDGTMIIDSEGNKLFKGVFEDYGKDAKEQKRIFIESKDNFFQYLTEKQTPKQGISYIENINGDLKVISIGTEDDELKINNYGGIKSISFEKITDQSQVLYYKQGELIGKLNNKGIITSGLISELGEIKIINPKTKSFESISAIIGDVFNSDQLNQVQEIKLAQELINNIKKTDKPVAILISQEDYIDEAINDLAASHDSAEIMADFLKQKADISKEKIIFIQDKTHEEIIVQLKNIKENNPNSNFFIYYSGHGSKDEKTGNYFLTAKDTSREGESYQNIISPSEFNKIFQKSNPSYLIDSCHSGGFCSGLSGGLRIAAAKDNQVGSQVINNPQIYSLFTKTLVSPRLLPEDYKLRMSLTDQLIINGLKNKWLTEVYSEGIEQRTQTPIVFKIFLYFLKNN